MTGDAGCSSGLPSVRFIAPTASSIPSVFGLGPAWFDTTKQYQPGVLPQQLEDGVKNKLQIWTVISPTLTDCKSQNCLHFTFKHASVCWFAASPILLCKLVQSLVPSTFICIILILRYQFIHTLFYASIILFISMYHFVSRIWCEVEKNYVPLLKKSAYPMILPTLRGNPRGFFSDKNSKKGP